MLGFLLIVFTLWLLIGLWALPSPPERTTHEDIYGNHPNYRKLHGKGPNE